MTFAALNLPDEVARRFERRCFQFPISSLPESQPESLRRPQPGRPFLLLDGRGRVLGTAVADPENDLYRLLSFEAESKLDAQFFRGRLGRAVELRRSLGLYAPGTACRILNGPGDGLPGFVAEQAGPYGVVYVYSRAFIELGRLCAQALRELLALDGVVLKVRPKETPRGGRPQQEVIGAEPPESYVVEEAGLRCEVHPLGGLNTGLFTDMREHRQQLRRSAGAQRVLNTFCYSGTLSVAAALGGARSVTSVDLSTGVLKWARENFRLNALDDSDPRYSFVASDVTQFLVAERGRGARYDLIVLDPPTFSAARPRAWSMREDYPDLIADAARVLPEEQGGCLWVASNARQGHDLEQSIRVGLAKAGRTAEMLAVGGLPADYPTPFEMPEERYLQLMVLRVR